MRSVDKLLFDIADSARLVIAFLGGMSRAEFDNDPKTQAAITYHLAIIGEAVKNLPQEWQAQHPAIPWSRISRMRDHLIHRYFNVDLDTIWDSGVNDVPALQNYIAPFVSPLLNEEEPA